MTAEPIRILYIDDYDLDRALIRDALISGDLEFHLIETENKEEFLSRLAEEEVDLVLSDFNILGFTGLEVLDIVKSQQPELPVIIVTGTGSEEIASEAIKRGAADYVIKTPQHIRRLPATIENVLETELIKEQRREALHNLRESESRYRDLLETLQEGIWGINAEGCTTFVNPALADMLGYTVEDMLGRHLFEFMTKEQVPTARVKLERRQSGLKEEHEFAFRHQEGGMVHTRISTAPILDEKGEYQGAVASVRDLTDQKQVERALQRSEEKFRASFQHADVAMAITDPEGRFTAANPAAVDLLGYPEPQLLEMTFREITLPEDQQVSQARFAQCLEDQEPYTIEKRFQTAEGEVLVGLTTVSPVSEKGELQYLIAHVQNITARVRTQQTLEENERQLSTLLGNLPGMAYRCLNNPEWEMLFLSKGCQALTGYSRDELLGTAGVSYTDLINAEDRDLVWRKVEAALQEDRSFEITYRIRTETGKEKWVWERGVGTLQDEDGNYLQLEGFISDITERRQAELEKKQTRQTLRTVLDSIDAHIYVADFETYQILYMNQNMIEDFGGDFTGEHCYRAFRGYDQPCDLCPRKELLKPDGSIGEPTTWEEYNPITGRWYLNTDRAIPWHDGQLAHIQIALDITDRKEMEESIRESETFLKEIFNNSLNAILVADDRGNYRNVNRAAVDMLGFPREDLLAMNVQDLQITSDVTLEHQYQDFLEEGTLIGDLHITRPDGEERVLHYQAVRIDEDFNLSMLSDITGRVRAEEELRSSETKYRELFENMLNAFALHEIILNEEGQPTDYRFLEVNDSFEEMTGLKKEQVTGRKVTEVIPGIQEDPADWIQKYGEVALTGTDLRFESYSQPLGKWYSILAFSPQKGQFATIFEDITDRKKAQAALQQRSEELVELTIKIEETQEAERARLARELHDQVGQSLALLGFNLNLVQEQLQAAGIEQLDKIQDAHSILEEVTTGIRSVMDDLRPAILDDYGLQAALHWLADKVNERSDLNTEVVGEPLEPRLEYRLENTLFRIAQEALTNAARHAEADRVTIKLDKTQDRVRLIIADDGRGFKPGDITRPADQKGWGLINMEERAVRAGGEFRLKTAPGQGTEITVTLPLE
jgi:PAS domain S-box-containing protein